VITLKFETYFVVVYCHTNSSKRDVQYFVLMGVVFCHTNSSKKGCAVFCCNGCSIMSYEFE